MKLKYPMITNCSTLLHLMNGKICMKYKEWICRYRIKNTFYQLWMQWNVFVNSVVIKLRCWMTDSKTERIKKYFYYWVPGIVWLWWHLKINPRWWRCVFCVLLGGIFFLLREKHTAQLVIGYRLLLDIRWTTTFDSWTNWCIWSQWKYKKKIFIAFFVYKFILLQYVWVLVRL